MSQVEATAVDAHDIFIKALLHLRPRGTDFLGNFISLWLEPKVHIHAWFSGENDKVRVWEFAVQGVDVPAFCAAIPEAEFKHEAGYADAQIYKVKVEK